jgi:hypothetical protein
MDMTYQIILHGFNASSSKENKKCFPTYPLYIGMYGLSNAKFVEMEAHAIEEYKFREGRYRRQ